MDVKLRNDVHDDFTMDLNHARIRLYSLNGLSVALAFRSRQLADKYNHLYAANSNRASTGTPTSLAVLQTTGIRDNISSLIVDNSLFKFFVSNVLQFCNVNEIWLTSCVIDDEDILQLLELRHLKGLHLSGCDASGCTEPWFSLYSDLTEVTVTGSTLSSELRDDIGRCEALQSLLLSSMKYSSERYSLPTGGLRELSITGATWLSSIVGRIKRQGQLHLLSIKCCDITDNEVRDVAECRSLRVIDIGCNDIGDLSLEYIATNRGISAINITNTDVTGGGVLNLHKCRPEIAVVV